MATNGKKPPQRETRPFLLRNDAAIQAATEGPFALAYGTMGGGFLLIGPFSTVGEAVDFAEMYLSAYHWELMTLQKPEEVKRG